MWLLWYYPVLGLIWLWEIFYFSILWLLEKPLIQFMQTKNKSAGINTINLYEKEDKDTGLNLEDLKNRENMRDEERNAPKVDILIHSKLYYRRILRHGLLGIGESYMDGLWDCDQVDEASALFCANGLLQFLMQLPWNRLINYLRFEAFNLQTGGRAFVVGRQHYDLGNELFESFLDQNMNYSCGYWKHARDLDEAQLHKMDLIARKLHLKPGMRVLDIGCGWGNLCKFLAEKYQVSVVGVTISVEQSKLAQQRCQGLSVEIKVTDYRKLEEKFDRIVSVGMFEHVGKHNYRTFFKVVHNCLEDDGLFLLHTIGVGSPDTPTSEPWLCTYIFPNSRLPYHTEIPKKADGLFLIEDVHNFGCDYDKTLLAWHANFVRNWPSIRHQYKDPDRFYRMWTYYLLMCAGVFRARKTQLWQIVLSKKGVKGGYVSVR